MKWTPAGRQTTLLALVLIVAGVLFVLLGLQGLWSSDKLPLRSPTPATASLIAAPKPTATEPLLPPPPTPTILHRLTSPHEPTQQPVVTAIQPTSAPQETIAPFAPADGLYTLQQRLGVGGANLFNVEDRARRLGFGWYLDWTVNPNRFHSAELEYVPMIRMREDGSSPDGPALLSAVDALPGALWLVGNEPDVKWQDNVTPDAYARAYHDLYARIKSRDPTSRVAIGGVSQPTPLRLRYLDLILQAYETRYGERMPVDVWNVHNFILREERDSWGVDIPPGMTDQTGRLREIDDHDDLSIFRQQIVDFRRWMKAQGQQDKPLIVTEYGILMPAEYGFAPQEVERFMLGTFEFFRSAIDPALGYPADGYRLVQRWCWFSLVDERYPTGNLVQVNSEELTPLGAAFGEYASSSSE